MISGTSTAAAAELPCELDPDCIDCFDYADGDEALALIWCDAHEAYHWKWVPRAWGGGRI
jgi:hypothetical protein